MSLYLSSSQATLPLLVWAPTLVLHWPQISHALLLLTYPPWLLNALRTESQLLILALAIQPTAQTYGPFPDPLKFHPEILKVEVTQASPPPYPSLSQDGSRTLGLSHYDHLWNWFLSLIHI